MNSTTGMSSTGMSSMSSRTVITSPKGLPLATANLSKVSHQTEVVSLRHAELGQVLAIDRAHVSQASDELATTREQIRLVSARLQRSQRAMAAYESECAPLVKAYELAQAGFKATYQQCAAGHGKGACVLCVAPSEVSLALFAPCPPLTSHPPPASATARCLAVCCLLPRH